MLKMSNLIKLNKVVALSMIFLCILFAGQKTALSQEAHLDSLEAYPGDTILMPLNFYGLLDVGAVSIYIAYDTLTLEYLGLKNLSPEAAGTLGNSLPFDTLTVVGLTWLAPGAQGVDFSDGKFLDMEFRYLGGDSALWFTSACEIVDFEAFPIDVTYYDGYVYEHQVGIPEPVAGEDLQIGWSGGSVTLQATGKKEDVHVRIYNLEGREILSRYYRSLESASIPFGHSEGIYLINVYGNDWRQVEKIYSGIE